MYEKDAKVVNVRCWVHNMFGYIHSGRYRVYHYIQMYVHIHSGAYHYIKLSGYVHSGRHVVYRYIRLFGFIHSGRYGVYQYIKLFRYIHMGCNVKVVSVVLGTLNCLGISEVVGIGCHINIVIVWCWVH